MSKIIEFLENKCAESIRFSVVDRRIYDSPRLKSQMEPGFGEDPYNDPWAAIGEKRNWENLRSRFLDPYGVGGKRYRLVTRA